MTRRAPSPLGNANRPINKNPATRAGLMSCKIVCVLALLATPREAQGGQPDAEESERGRLGNASGYSILDDDVGNRRDCAGVDQLLVE